MSEKYSEFELTLPKKGCYNSGDIFNKCYSSNSYKIGYLGSYKLPFGFKAYTYLINIGKINPKIGVSIQYKFDRNKNWDFEINNSKKINLFKKENVSENIVYNYQNRKFNFIDRDIIFHNHQLYYDFKINNIIGLNTGINYLIDHKKKVGAVLGISKFIDSPQLYTSVNTLIFENEINYRISISKAFYYPNQHFIISRNASIRLYYEKFKNYHDINLSLMFDI